MKEIKRNLKEIKKAGKPERGFKNALASELGDEFGREYPANRPSFKRALAMPVALVVVLVTMGMGSYAYASPEVTQGHFLHPFKRGIEAVEALLPRSPEGAAEFHARMMERRIAEGEVMMREERLGPGHLEKIAEELDVTVDELIRARDDLEFRRGLIDRLQAQNLRYNHLFETVFVNNIDRRPSPGEIDEKMQALQEKINEADLTPEERQAIMPQMHMFGAPPKLPDDFVRPEDLPKDFVPPEHVEGEPKPVFEKPRFPKPPIERGQGMYSSQPPVNESSQ
ncbi:MAG: hypothetical protein ABIA47_00405 [bacterium]